MRKRVEIAEPRREECRLERGCCEGSKHLEVDLSLRANEHGKALAAMAAAFETAMFICPDAVNQYPGRRAVLRSWRSRTDWQSEVVASRPWLVAVASRYPYTCDLCESSTLSRVSIASSMKSIDISANVNVQSQRVWVDPS